MTIKDDIGPDACVMLKHFILNPGKTDLEIAKLTGQKSTIIRAYMTFFDLKGWARTYVQKGNKFTLIHPFVIECAREQGIVT